jgi:hypothetical protein
MSIKRSLLALVVSVVVFTGCNGGSAVTVTQLSPGAECAAGGVKLETSGKDPQIICNGTTGTNGSNGTNGTNGTNGASGTQTLLSETVLPVGDARCANGGTLVQTGLDNGGDGGVANDGVLEAGEVTASTPVCNGDTGARPGSVTPPTGAVGTDTIKVNGGAAAAGQAGGGGEFYAAIYGGTNGGHVKAFTTGHVDATFTVPTLPTPNYGSAPLTISTDTVAVQATSPSGLDAGTVFTYQGRLEVALADGGATAVTGLSVAAGATLTLSDSINLDNSLTNAGTIKIPAGSEFDINCDQYVSTAGSKLLGRGDDAAGTTSATSGAYIYLSTNGDIINQGSVDFSGGKGPNGASGGAFQFSAYGKVYNTGNLVALGGEGLTGTGANGGNITVRANYGVYNSGALDASGGRGAGTVGGSGGTVELQSRNAPGPVQNSGALTSNGGDAAAAQGNAGQGGYIELYAYSAPLLTSGVLTARGGSADLGSRGGRIYVEESSGGGGPINGSNLAPSGNVWVSGAIDASGGAGFNGGSGGSAPGYQGGRGGYIEVSMDAYYNPNGAELALFGYASIAANGADGLSGGTGGSVYLEQGNGDSNTFGGAVINNVALSAAGGAGSTEVLTDGGVNYGGSGGDIYLETQRSYYTNTSSFEQLVNTGALDVSGATGGVGGNAGSIYLWGLQGASTTGAIKATGGVGTQIRSGNSGSISCAAQNGPTTFGSTVSAVGPNSAHSDAGGGGYVALQGTIVHLTVPLDLHGGDGDTLVNGTGGFGGALEAWSLAGATDLAITAPAGINVKHGTGVFPGSLGSVMVDGVSVTGNWTY